MLSARASLDPRPDGRLRMEKQRLGQQDHRLPCKAGVRQTCRQTPALDEHRKLRPPASRVSQSHGCDTRRAGQQVRRYRSCRPPPLSDSARGSWPGHDGAGDCSAPGAVARSVGADVARRRSRWRRARSESDTAGGAQRVFLARGSGGAGGRPARFLQTSEPRGIQHARLARGGLAQGEVPRSRAPSDRRSGAPRGGRAQRISMSPSRDTSHSRLEWALSRMTLAFCFSAYAPATRSAGMNTSR